MVDAFFREVKRHQKAARTCPLGKGRYLEMDKEDISRYLEWRFRQLNEIFSDSDFDIYIRITNPGNAVAPACVSPAMIASGRGGQPGT